MRITNDQITNREAQVYRGIRAHRLSCLKARSEVNGNKVHLESSSVQPPPYSRAIPAAPRHTDERLHFSLVRPERLSDSPDAVEKLGNDKRPLEELTR